MNQDIHRGGLEMSRANRAVVIITTLVVAVAIGVADVSDYLPELTAFVLIPVIVGTYFQGLRFGVIVAIVAAAAELVAHLKLGAGIGHAGVVFNTLSHSFIYILTAALIDRLTMQLRIITNLEAQRNNDLDIAKSVHESVFAPIPDSYGNLSIGSKVAFARELGGDYYFFTDLDGNLFFCIADISGKSTAASLFAALLNQSVTEALEHTTDLTALVSGMKLRLSRALPEDMFITMFCALINEKEIAYVNAGAPPPLLFSKREGSAKMLRSHRVLPIGILPALEIESMTEPFGPGDVFLAMTDGITESPEFREEPYEKLQELLVRHADASAQDITNAIFSQSVPGKSNIPLDDVILVCIKR